MAEAATHREAAGHKGRAYTPRVVRRILQEDRRNHRNQVGVGVEDTLLAVVVESWCNPCMKDEQVAEVRPIDLA